MLSIGCPIYQHNSLDAEFNNVKLLLKGNAPAGGTTIRDSSLMNWSQSSILACNNTNTQSKFEGYSIYQSSTTNAQVTFPTTSTWSSTAFGSDKWTVETWFYLPAGLYGTYNSCELSNPSGAVMNISVFPTYVGIYTGNSSILATVAPVGAVTSSTWHYLAICKNTVSSAATTSSYDVYLNGTKLVVTTAATWKSLATQTWQVGRADGAPRPQKHFDDYRITLGVNRYSGASMTVPTREAGIAKL